MSDSDDDQKIEKPRQSNYVMTPARMEALQKGRDARKKQFEEIRKEKAISHLTKKEEKVRQVREAIEKGEIKPKPVKNRIPAPKKEEPKSDVIRASPTSEKEEDEASSDSSVEIIIKRKPKHKKKKIVYETDDDDDDELEKVTHHKPVPIQQQPQQYYFI